MRLPGLLLIGLTVNIIAVDALDISTTQLPKAIKAYKRICYYTNTGQHRLGKGKFFPKDMDTSLCSHFVYSHASVSDSFTIIPTDSNDDGPGGMYERLNSHKKNLNVVTMLQVVLYSSSNLVNMTKMLMSEESRHQFIQSSMDFARNRSFDGILLSFYYPGVAPSPPEDTERFTLLLEEMDGAMKEEGNITGKKALILAAVFSHDKDIIDKAYELSIIHTYLDFLNVATFDILNDSLSVTQHHSPLFAGNNIDEQNTVEWVAEYYESQGVPPNKICIGMPVFGRGFTLKNADNGGIGATIVGPSPPGEYTQEPGRLAYYEICSMLNDSSVTEVYMDDAKVSYLHNGTLWIGYDDQRSMVEKANWVKHKGYAGWFVWTGYDDFNGTFCNQGRYPLTTTLSNTMLSSG